MIKYAAGTYDFAVNIATLINTTINKTFGIHNLLKNYSWYYVFNRENRNTFNVLTCIQVRTDKYKFMQIKKIDSFSVLAFIQARTDNKKFMQIKNGQG